VFYSIRGNLMSKDNGSKPSIDPKPQIEKEPTIPPRPPPSEHEEYTKTYDSDNKEVKEKK